MPNLKSQRPCPQRRFVVECRSDGVCREVAVQKQFVALRAVEPPPAVFSVVAAVFVYVVENQTVDAVLLECYGRVHLLALVEAECSDQPAVARAALRAQNQIFGDVVLAFSLRESEIRQRQKILVENHFVVEILVTRNARQRHAPPVVLDAQPLGRTYAAVRRLVVVFDAPALRRSVGVAALRQNGECRHRLSMLNALRRYWNFMRMLPIFSLSHSELS